MTHIITVSLCGCVIADGIGSIIYYRKQTVKEHLVRVARVGIAVTLIVLDVAGLI